MRNLFALLALLSLFSAAAAADVPGQLAEKGKTLFSDDFQRPGGDLGSWKVIIPGFQVSDGMLIGTQDRSDHGSVGRVYLPMKDVVISFRFRLAGSPRFNLVIDDKNHKGSHAGHICRIAFAGKQIRLGDDKEGIMRNDIFAMRRDLKQKAAAEKLLTGRSTTVKANLRSDRWYTAVVEIVDDEMRLSLDGKPVGYLKSPGIAHPTKESMHFTVSGKAMHFDDVTIWEAKK